MCVGILVRPLPGPPVLRSSDRRPRRARQEDRRAPGRYEYLAGCGPDSPAHRGLQHHLPHPGGPLLFANHPSSLGHRNIYQCQAMMRVALERHFARTGQSVVFEDRTHFNFREVRFHHNSPARVAVLVLCSALAVEPHACLASLRRTLDRTLARSSSSTIVRRTGRRASRSRLT